MKKKLVVVAAALLFAASIFAQARHGGAGSALNWHEWSSRPEWVKNIDEYDWEYALGSRLTTRMVKPNLVPRSVMELIDRQVGRGAMALHGHMMRMILLVTSLIYICAAMDCIGG